MVRPTHFYLIAKYDSLRCHAYKLGQQTTTNARGHGVQTGLQLLDNPVTPSEYYAASNKRIRIVIHEGPQR